MAVKKLGITTASAKKQSIDEKIKALLKQQQQEDRRLKQKVATSLMEQLPKIGIQIESDDDVFMVLGALLLMKERNEIEVAIQKGKGLYDSRNNIIEVETLSEDEASDVMHND